MQSVGVRSQVRTLPRTFALAVPSWAVPPAGYFTFNSSSEVTSSGRHLCPGHSSYFSPNLVYIEANLVISVALNPAVFKTHTMLILPCVCTWPQALGWGRRGREVGVKGGGGRQAWDSHKPEKSSPPKSELCRGDGVDVEGKRVTEGSDPRMRSPQRL